MKILFIGYTDIETEGLPKDSMEAHVVSAFKKLNIDYKYCNAHLGGRVSGRINKLLELAMTDFRLTSSTPIERSILKSAKEFKPDLSLALLGNYTPPSTIQKIRDVTGSPVACWCQDHMGTMGRQYILGSKFDFIFSKDEVMVDRFRNFTSASETHYLPEACNPDIHRPVTDLTDNDKKRYKCDVTTAATMYYYRSEILETLSSFNLKIWGPVPRFYDGPLRKYCTDESVYTREKSACFNLSKIVINSLFPMEMGGLNARAFEVAGCGGFQLISHSDVIEKHFKIGKEIDTFRNLDELQKKVNYYLNNDCERQKIAEAGRRRAHKEHTYEQRIQTMLNIIF